MKKRPGLTHFLKKKEIKYQRFGVSVENPPCKSDKIKGFFYKWANPGIFLLIFAIFKEQFFTEKIADFNWNRTQTMGRGEHADHLNP